MRFPNDNFTPRLDIFYLQWIQFPRIYSKPGNDFWIAFGIIAIGVGILTLSRFTIHILSIASVTWSDMYVARTALGQSSPRNRILETVNYEISVPLLSLKFLLNKKYIFLKCIT